LPADSGGTGLDSSGSTGVPQIVAGAWSFPSVVSPAYGGTGLSSYAIGDLIYADGASSLAKLAGVDTGNALLSGGVGTAPAWGKIGLTTHVSGTLAASSGGTGLSSYAVGDLLYADGAGSLAKLAAVASGSYFSSVGVGVAPAWATLNQAAVAGLTTTNSPTFAGANLTGPLDIARTNPAGAMITLTDNGVAGTQKSIVFRDGDTVRGSIDNIQATNILRVFAGEVEALRFHGDGSLRFPLHTSGVLTTDADGDVIANNVLTANQILYGAAGNTIASSANFTFDGSLTLGLASGGIIDFASGGLTLTHSAPAGADTLTLAGGVFVLSAGTAAAASLQLGASTVGLFAASANELGVALDGAQVWNLAADALSLLSDTGKYRLGVGSDLILGREAAAILQMGIDAAAPVAQTLKGPDGSGTDKAGGNLTIGAGRGTGTGLGGSFIVATAPAGGVSGTAQNALVDRVTVLSTGVVWFSPQDNAATPVAPTATLKAFLYNKSVVDDGIITLPAVTTIGRGRVFVEGGATYAEFFVNGTGTVTLLGAAVLTTADVVANADTDTKLCIGTAAAQEPLQIKNRLGAAKVINVEFWYD